jgi:DNA-binding response OmpR family regulator
LAHFGDAHPELPVKILIVEDELKTGDYLRQGLSRGRHVVDLARDGLDGLHLALNGDYDLIVLDVMLPSLDGWGVAADAAAQRARDAGAVSDRAR